jgi:cold shock CspA family protein
LGVVAGRADVGVGRRAIQAAGHQALDAGLDVRVVVGGRAQGAGRQVLAVYAVAQPAQGADRPRQEVVLSVVALCTGIQGTVVGQHAVLAIIVSAVDATNAPITAMLAGILSGEVPRSAHTLP